MRRARGTAWVLLLSLLCASRAFAAVPATAVWEVRPTTGSNLNGGGYDSAFTGVGSSVDYSQQASAQVSFTDLTAVASTTLTSASNPFTAAMVGNAIHLQSAAVGTPGYYFITAFTNSGQVTIDRSTTITTGVGKLGGATASFTGQTTTTLAASLTPGNIVYVKAETWSEVVTLAVAGTAVLPIVVEGYSSSRGDAPGRVGATDSRPKNNAPAGAGITTSASHYLFKYVWVNGATGAGFSSTTTSHVYLNCRASANGAEGFLTSSTLVSYVGVEADSNTTIGISVGGNAIITGAYSHHNTTTGVTSNGSTVQLTRSILAANGSHGISLTASAFVLLVGNTVDGNTGSGLSTGALTSGSVILNNIFSNNTVNGVTASSTSVKGILVDYNDFYGNGTDRTNIAVGTHDLALNPTYVGTASGNYAIGTPLQSRGTPGTFAGATSIGYLDIGAVQRRPLSPQTLLRLGTPSDVFR